MTTHDDNGSHVKLSPARLEAFSDSVMAVIITITILSLKIPIKPSLTSLQSVFPIFLVYLISFQLVGTYWNNHHHLMLITDHVSASIMWSNLYLLFWLSFIPVVTEWLGGNFYAHLPTALYAFVLLMCSLGYTLLQWRVLKHVQNREDLIEELRSKPKGVISLILYTVAVVMAFYFPIISDILIILVSIMWFIPDRRLEKYVLINR